ncbi:MULTISPECIES: DUF6884 domain-containing protein [Pseudarthrobacter]|uniref:DUF6884 domain-containing protein n=1 Tax=Pseudarthrobacter TaxID=1742993 RepID=UPI00203CA75B|nr:DUF6884 domain-containing protein [Pseudarthrobacter sp. NCCP-2145]GKV72973.1 hypothetical protein NCCP2145_23540 [Pseudarthrobacter sp. NCCP-2145]
MFKKASAYAELSCDRWYVLSAKLTEELVGLEDVKLIALAGEQYRVPLYRGVWAYEIPMKGMGIGQQLGWLTERLAASNQPG